MFVSHMFSQTLVKKTALPVTPSPVPDVGRSQWKWSRHNHDKLIPCMRDIAEEGGRGDENTTQESHKVSAGD